jgi:hypothetical protein
LALVSAIVLIAVGQIVRMDDSETATAELNANSPVLKVGTNRGGSTSLKQKNARYRATARR